MKIIFFLNLLKELLLTLNMIHSFKIFLITTTFLLGFSKNIFFHDYGAYVNGQKNVSCALYNGWTIYQAIMDSQNGDQIILQSDEIMYYIPYSESGVNPYYTQLENITFSLRGVLIAHNNISSWPMISEDEYVNMLDIRFSNDITINGGGIIDGQGFKWWSDFLHGIIPRRRPTLIEFEDSTNILITNITLLNSPRFNIYANNVLHLEVKHITIWVDTQQQQYLSQLKSLSTMFPFNTDGIDVAGQDIYLHHLNITNYDDSVAIKPSNINSFHLENRTMNCTQDILVENLSIFRGVGLSIGSVSSSKKNCVRNIIFQNITAKQPLKLIYIKTGSVDDASEPEALIENINYLNIKADNSVLYPIYIGPQQQKEPDGSGDGFWPSINPYVSIKNISIINLYVNNSYSYPGVIRCDLNNPCSNLLFVNITITKELLNTRDKYICSTQGSIQGNYNNLSYPSFSKCGLQLSN